MLYRKAHTELEILNKKLTDDSFLKEYKEIYDGYTTSLFPLMLGKLLVSCGNFIYGKEPSYLKFRAVEVIARVPYHSWTSAAYTFLTLFYTNEDKALKFSNVATFSQIAQDNETMHVIVITQLAKIEERAGFIRHTFIPLFFAFFYFWSSYILYLINPRYSFELNYLFESHAFEQYNRFLVTRGEELKSKPITSNFLKWYGRSPKNQYEFFLSVRNDEIIHRNTSIDEINK